MKKFLLYTLLTATLSCSFIYAETPKQPKNTKANDVNKTMTDEEFMRQFMILDERKKDAEAKTKAIEKLEKTVNELGKQVGVD